MKTWTLAIATILFCSTIGGCLSESNDDTEDKITNLENSQAELALELDEQKQINEQLYSEMRMVESNNQQLFSDLESSYILAMDALVLANSQTLDEINATNAASFDNLLISLNILQTNLQNSQDSINQISLIIDEMDDDNSSNEEAQAQILALQQSLQSLQSSLQTSIYDLENRLNQTRAMNDFSYLDFQGAQLFNFNNGLGPEMDSPIFDFANLENASLTYSNFSDASFVNANLAGADGIFATFHNTDFSRAAMYNGIWRQSDFSNAIFVSTNLVYTEFRWSDLSSANLSGAYAYGGSNWFGVNLSGANLTNAWMYDLDLRNADLTGADLTGARLAYLNPSYGAADISGVTWTNAICPDGTHASTIGNTCANNL
jgi:uncharacterized protein YjbI with pentapeptide repeats